MTAMHSGSFCSCTYTNIYVYICQYLKVQNVKFFGAVFGWEKTCAAQDIEVCS